MKKFLIIALMMAPLSVFAQKFAHFNLADIMPNMTEFKTAQAELETLGKQYEDDVKRLQEELQKKMEDYQKTTDLPENVRQRREAELQDLYNRMQQVSADNSEQYQKASAEKMQVVQQLVRDAIKKIGEEGGYVYVVDTSSGSIPFINSALSTDITPELKKALKIQ